MRAVNANGAFCTSEFSLIPTWNSGFAHRLQQLKMRPMEESKRHKTNNSVHVDNGAIEFSDEQKPEKSAHSRSDSSKERDVRQETYDIIHQHSESENQAGINSPVDEMSSIPFGKGQFSGETTNLELESSNKSEISIFEGASPARNNTDDSLLANPASEKEDMIDEISTEVTDIQKKEIPEIPASIIMAMIGSYTNNRKAWNALASLNRETFAISKNQKEFYRPWPSIRWRASTITVKGGRRQALCSKQPRCRRKARGAVQTSARPRTVAFGKDYLCYATDRGDVLFRSVCGDGSTHVCRGHIGCVNTIKCCGNWIVSAGDDLETRIWNVNEKSCQASLDDHDDSITSVSILHFDSSRQDKFQNSNPSPAALFCMLVATSGLDGDVHLYGVYCEGDKVMYTKHFAIFTEEFHRKPIYAVVLYEKDGRLNLFSGGRDGRLKLWNIDAAIRDNIRSSNDNIEVEAPPVKIFENTCIYRYDGEIKSIAISQDKERIAVAFGRTICHSHLSEKTLQNYEYLHHHDHNHRFQRRLEQQRRLRNQGQNTQHVGTNCDIEEDHWKVLKGHSGDIRCIDFAPDGRTVASACSDGSIRLWQLGEGTWKRKWKAHNSFMVCSLAFSPDGQSLLSAGSDGTIAIEDLFP